MEKNIESIKKIIGSIDSYETLKQMKIIFEDLLQNEKEEIFIASLTEEIRFMDQILEKHVERIKGKMMDKKTLSEDSDGFVSGDIEGFMNRIIEEPLHEEKKGKIVPFNTIEDDEEFESYELELENYEKEQSFFKWVREKMNDILIKYGLKEPDLKIVDKDDEEKY